MSEIGAGSTARSERGQDLAQRAALLTRASKIAAAVFAAHSVVPGPKLTPGCSLIREWGGARHEVRVLEEGFGYQSERFSSLSQVAQHITGAKRSGRLFFGLKEKPGTHS